MDSYALIDIVLGCRTTDVCGADGLCCEEGGGKVEGLGKEDVVL